ncbi:hypothetical protein [Amycolatopsis sp. YIM 10]|uniref:hypothetical protein n=1 Tax=Amycolatopsis sp. YIM 10 TaxID=2653857 RepID=UPI00128FD7F8|nr:hypothetical protein [Amycolatopsis sp. YIM 10]QFU89721.1 hypothetical protein YIM_22720 [Amycolatopsis sp. YIM 10]
MREEPEFPSPDDLTLRSSRFDVDFLDPLVSEARFLGLSMTDVLTRIITWGDRAPG